MKDIIKYRKSYFSYFILILMSLMIYGCNTEPEDNIDLYPFAEKWFGNFSLADKENLVVRNAAGSVYINGISIRDTARIYLYKSIFAETENYAKEHFRDIVFEHTAINDSVVCCTTVPDDTDRLKYTCSLDLEVNENMVTYISAPNKGVNISFMDTTIYVTNSQGDIVINKHNGSCDVKTSKGNITAELIIEKNGFCKCYTSEGNIIVEIPQNSSAVIYAKTGEGSITYGNLSISNLNESTNLLTGELSGGDGEIRLETKKGNIIINGL